MPSLRSIAGAALAGRRPAHRRGNTDVHQQIGFMAEKFLTGLHGRSVLAQNPGTRVQRVDWERGGMGGRPPSYCNVYYHRDCTTGGCVVSAIANQTEILRSCITSVKADDYDAGTNITCSYALKWVVHFLGDIAQPLHASGIAAGGNFFDVIYNNKSTELHAVWDGEIIYSDADVSIFPNTSIEPFFVDNLLPRILADSFSEPTADWLSCTDPSTPIACALSWARESNAWTCDYVYSQKFNNTDLATSGYAEGAFPIVELQVSKAALRLGTWLNRLVEGRYDRDREVVLQTTPSWVGGPNEGS
ncbi:S1/P1 nuclease [Botryosphaeria dothidea]|uniref:S1/P1 nuclease n=1 Tax=Botryosphaeria dothidea TaxID=55169 RepID=A0A8H4IPY1_9PEZI|nr:S1/P1 nuclease [Botryosphaeria dothidea]